MVFKNNKNPNKLGIILIDKPKNWTSHDVVGRLRAITKIRKIGHAGTLDPLATGLLIVAVERAATKQIDSFIKMDKEYEAEIFLGGETATYDAESKVINKYSGAKILRKDILLALKKFTGEQLQIPPMYSAKKIKGKRLYELARRNIEVDRPPIKIKIYNIKLLSYKWPILKARIKCSSGTYIRSIAHDLGRFLGCGAYLKNLRRTKISNFNVKKAISIKKVKPGNWDKYLKKI